jgi:HSP20 family protein
MHAQASPAGSLGLEEHEAGPMVARSPAIQGGRYVWVSSPYDDVCNEFRRLERAFDAFLDGAPGLSGTRNIRAISSGEFPGINVASTPESVTVYLFAPGIDPKTLDLSIQQNVLSISGERALQRREDGTDFRQERFSGPFRRVVALPDDVMSEKVEARYIDGIVQITIGRRPGEQPRRIDVH